MLIEHMSELRPEGLGEEGGREEDVSDLMALYRAAKQRFDEDEDFKTRSREAVTRCVATASAIRWHVITWALSACTPGGNSSPECIDVG